MPDGKNNDPYRLVRRLIWLYFALLIFEGAFRKWIIPSLSNQLLLIRDPLVLLIYLAAMGSGCFSLKNGWLLTILGLGGVTLAASVLAESFKPTVALFGFRTNFMHLPLIFVMAEALNVEDIAWLGRWVIRISIPMAALMAAQFRGGEGHWLNVGAGEGASQIISTMGKMRASGTFSFITGPVLFFPLAAGFLFYSQLRRGLYSLPLVAGGFLSAAIASAVGGSRSLLGAIALEAVGFFIGILFHPPSLSRAFRILILCGLTYLGVSGFDLFKDATAVMKARIEFAATGGGAGFWERVFSAFDPGLKQATLFGKGLGVGTNVGAALLGRRGQFLISENEWQRITGESGLLLGPAYILLRVGIVTMLLLTSLGEARRGNLLPILMLSAVGSVFMNGQFSPPTVLGFAVFGAGACLAAANVVSKRAPEISEKQDEADGSLHTRKRARFGAPVHVGPAGAAAANPAGGARPATQPGRWSVRPPGTETRN